MVRKIIARFQKEGFFGGIIYFLRAAIVGMVCLNRKVLYDHLLPFVIKTERSFPIQEIIVLECESDMDDNPRAFYEYLLKIQWNKKHKIIWIVKNVNKCKELYSSNNVHFISRYNKSFFNQVVLNYYLSTAKWFVFSHPYWFKKNKEVQFVLNVWHGVGMKGWGSNSESTSDSFDKVIATSEFFKNILAEKWPKEQIEVFEYPRLDFFFHVDKEDILRQIISDYQLTNKIIMCMPTFRQTRNWIDSEVVDRYGLGVISNREELLELNTFLAKNEIFIIVKLHPLQNLSFISREDLSNIKYLTNTILFENKIILYKLLSCCDALLTDVSSVYNDYLMLNRPIGFFMENFLQFERGYLVNNPLDYMPGEYIYNKNDLRQFLDNIVTGNDHYKEDRLRVYSLLHVGKDSRNSERLANWLFSN